MTISVAQFRVNFPEFDDPVRYTDGLITFWMGNAIKRLPECRWQDLLDDGIQLFTAHQIVLAARAQMSANSGALPGTSNGVTAAKTVDKVSVSYDTNAVVIEGGGHWNMTTYGIQFLQLSRMVGSGGFQL